MHLFRDTFNEVPAAHDGLEYVVFDMSHTSVTGSYVPDEQVGAAAHKVPLSAVFAGQVYAPEQILDGAPGYARPGEHIGKVVLCAMHIFDVAS